MAVGLSVTKQEGREELIGIINGNQEKQFLSPEMAKNRVINILAKLGVQHLWQR